MNNRKNAKKEFAPNICLECVKKDSGCCSSYPFIPLTIKDIERIKKLGYKLEDFVLVQKYRKNMIDTSEKWWADGFVNHDKKKYKLTVKKKKDNSCVFLKQGKGCTLGKNRPFVCKIYPFWVDSKGKVIYERDEEKDCLLGKRNVPIKHAVEMIGEKRKLIKKYRKEIRKDCIENLDKSKILVCSMIKQR
ncbi:MAG: YkgJ family cysteine cluster protein [Candidatus Pacearchaeota archaeon]|jgi:Fe-S-cluster containining protein